MSETAVHNVRLYEHCWGVTFKAAINEQSLKIAATAPRSSTAVVRNFFTDIKR